jgi:hypothetical protein
LRLPELLNVLICRQSLETTHTIVYQYLKISGKDDIPTGAPAEGLI